MYRFWVCFAAHVAFAPVDMAVTWLGPSKLGGPSERDALLRSGLAWLEHYSRDRLLVRNSFETVILLWMKMFGYNGIQRPSYSEKA